MRTTVDLAEDVLTQVKEIAAERNASLSATIADLTARGLEQVRGPMRVAYDEVSGFPVARFGRPVTTADIAAARDEPLAAGLPRCCAARADHALTGHCR